MLKIYFFILEISTTQPPPPRPPPLLPRRQAQSCRNQSNSGFDETEFLRREPPPPYWLHHYHQRISATPPAPTPSALQQPAVDFSSHQVVRIGTPVALRNTAADSDSDNELQDVIIENGNVNIHLKSGTFGK